MVTIIRSEDIYGVGAWIYRHSHGDKWVEIFENPDTGYQRVLGESTFEKVVDLCWHDWYHDTESVTFVIEEGDQMERIEAELEKRRQEYEEDGWY